MYASPEEIINYLNNDPAKPFILCEYMHSMGIILLVDWTHI